MAGKQSAVERRRPGACGRHSLNRANTPFASPRLCRRGSSYHDRFARPPGRRRAPFAPVRSSPRRREDRRTVWRLTPRRLCLMAMQLAIAASEKIAFRSPLDRVCGALPTQLVCTCRARVRTAHTAHVSTTSSNVARISSSVRSRQQVETKSCSQPMPTPLRTWRSREEARPSPGPRKACAGVSVCARNMLFASF